MSRPFHFKQFSIVQERAAMKVGTDGVLIGSWATSNAHHRILDIGCGTGLISLMLAQRFPEAIIDAIDIDENAINDARINITNSKWAERIALHKTDLLSFESKPSYDLIVSNPPFFEADTRSPIASRAVARSGNESTFMQWILKAKSLLSPDGSFAFIYPIEEWKRVEAELKSIPLYITRICKVSPTQDKAPHRVLLQLSLKENAFIEEGTFFIEKSRHIYSEEYIKLTRSFYLKMS